MLTKSHDSRAESPTRNRDAGETLIELLIAIVLLGMTVVAVLSGLQTVVKAGTVDRDHAQSFEWLQAASDAVYQSDRVPCTSDGAGRLAAIASYDAAANTATVPPVWDGTNANIVVTNVEYLGRLSVSDDFEWGESFCFEGAGFIDSPLYTQRVTIEVTPPNATRSQTLEMVKSEG